MSYASKIGQIVVPSLRREANRFQSIFRYAVMQADFTNNIGGKMPTIAMELKPKVIDL